MLDAEVANQVDTPSLGLLSLFAKADCIMYQTWFKVAEIAQQERCSEKTIRNYIRWGYLKAHRRGPRSIFIHIDDYNNMFRPFGKSYLRKY
jgi:hypothetical protein